ncbi:MAG: glycogen debranching enzyme, partial [Acidimicrobiia bacterium]
AVNELRARRSRAILATMLLSQGVPMLLAGDEFGRTQRGNNNAYCQDNEISWYDWASIDEDLLDFCRELVAFRKDHPVFRRRRWFEGRSVRGSDHDDIAWYNTDGSPMSDHDWRQGYAKSLAVYLNGKGITTTDRLGQRVVDDSFLVLFNAHSAPVQFAMAEELSGLDWELALDSATGVEPGIRPDGSGAAHVPGWSVVVLKKRNGVDR